MDLTIFQRLVLLGIAFIIQMISRQHGTFAKMLISFACGHRTDSQMKDKFELWKMDERKMIREAHDATGD